MKYRQGWDSDIIPSVTIGQGKDETQLRRQLNGLLISLKKSVLEYFTQRQQPLITNSEQLP